MDKKERALLSSETRGLDFVEDVDIQTKNYKDVAWGVGFLFHLLLILSLSFSYGMIALASADPKSISVINDIMSVNRSHLADTGKFVGGIFISVTVSSIISIIWVQAMAKLASRLIFITIVTTIISSVMLGLILFSFEQKINSFYTLGGTFSILFAIIGFLFFISVRNRIEFAAATLSVACEAVVNMSSILLYASVILGAQIIWCIFWAIATIGVATNESSTSIYKYGKSYELSKCKEYTYTNALILSPALTLTCNNSKCMACVCANTLIKQGACLAPRLHGFIYFLLILSLLWTCTVLSNIVHCTTAGAVTNWWKHEFPSKIVVRNSFRRTLTYSFGSICLGSLMVACIRTFRTVVEFLVRSSKTLPRDNTHTIRTYLLQCFSYLLGILDRLMEYFNKYAFCFVSYNHTSLYPIVLTVAIYGESFCESSRLVINLFRERGWTTIINDDIIDSVLNMGHLIIGFSTMVIMHFYSTSVKLDHVNITLLTVLGFLVGFLMSSVTLRIISSAVATVYVCYADYPEALLSSHPDRYHELSLAWRKFYPKALSSSSSSDQDVGYMESGDGLPSPLRGGGSTGSSASSSTPLGPYTPPPPPPVLTLNNSIETTTNLITTTSNNSSSTYISVSTIEEGDDDDSQYPRLIRPEKSTSTIIYTTPILPPPPMPKNESINVTTTTSLLKLDDENDIEESRFLGDSLLGNSKYMDAMEGDTEEASV